MAQAILDSQDRAGSTLKDKETESDKKEECAVCLQPCTYPTILPCNRDHCDLCIKRAANPCKRCRMCCQEIPPDFVDRPQLVEIEDTHKELDSSKEEYHWFFEGRNGWWKYGSRLNKDLETMHNLGRTEFEIFICDNIYIVDFRRHCQYIKYSRREKRYIKRDRIDAPCAGVSNDQYIDVEKMAKDHKLHQVKNNILSECLTKHLIPHNSKGKKEDLINKILSHMRNTQILKHFRV